MSGGSLDYIYQKVNCVADELSRKDKTILQRAFADHLRKVAIALHDIEWVINDDYSTGDDEGAIQAVLGDKCDVLAMEVVHSDIKQLISQLEKLTNKKSVEK